jgi:hypothetical protein
MISPASSSVSRLIKASLASRPAFVILMVCALSFAVQGQQSSDAPLNNAAVVKLVKAGFKEKTVIAIIHNRPSQFKLDTEQLIELKRSGVSENIIVAMMSQDDSFEMLDDEWGDTSLNRDSTRRGDDGPGTPQSSGTDIFGSSGGSRSQSRSRGGNGGSQNDGNITGSATVRILRPPTEAGRTSVTLERTPSMSNEAVIRLVDAGFSEGTIIKRIEESPVEFDLSPMKLDDLRKRRVTDPIIAAMRAAMGDKDGDKKPAAPLPKMER